MIFKDRSQLQMLQEARNRDWKDTVSEEVNGGLKESVLEENC